MGLISNQRGSRTETAQEGLPIFTGIVAVPKKKWSNLLPLFVALVVIAEIAYLGRLDMAKNAAMVDSLANFFYRSREAVIVDDLGIDMLSSDPESEESKSCEEWLKTMAAKIKVVKERNREKEKEERERDRRGERIVKRNKFINFRVSHQLLLKI